MKPTHIFNLFVFSLICGVCQAQPVITTHPKSQSNISGTTIALSVSVAPAASLKYQWRKDAVEIPGKTTTTLLVTNFSAAQAGAYDVVVTNLSGSVTSAVANLTLEAGYVFSTIAGLSTNSAYRDGVGSSARFFGNFRGLAVDGAGNLLVADTRTLRKVTPAGVVTTLAGSPTAFGSADGTNGTAQFKMLTGVAIAPDGNIFVCDYFNYTVRKITPEGVVTTLAGAPGQSGSVDGTGNAARFKGPNGLACTPDGRLVLTEYNPNGLGSRALRVITQSGTVSTPTISFDPYPLTAGVAVDSNTNIFFVDSTSNSSGIIWRVRPQGPADWYAGRYPGGGAIDGYATNAAFKTPWGIGIDGGNTLFVVDQRNYTIRRISTNGIVSTIAGLAQVSGIADGVGAEARFYYPWGVTTDTNGTIYVADNVSIRKGVPYTGAPVIIQQPLCQSVAPGSNVTFSITLTGAPPVTCQWQFQGVDLPGETNLSLTITNVQMDNVGLYRVYATNSLASDASVYASLGLLGLPLSFVTSQTNALEYLGDGLHLKLAGLVGQGQIVVYASTNLTAWVPVYTNFAGFGELDFVDPAATNYLQRFYRASVPSAP